jgi:ribosomal-protein-alanine N-acetyltransferase
VVKDAYNACVLRVREYEPQDFEQLIAIDEACFVEGIAYSVQEMRYFLNRTSSFALVGEESGRIQGFVIAHQFRVRRLKETMGQIITIDVLPEARQSGLGSRLLTAVEERLRDAGCTYVSLETAVDNLPALKFYKKHGYTGLKILPNYYLDSLDALLMGKKL